MFTPNSINQAISDKFIRVSNQVFLCINKDLNNCNASHQIDKVIKFKFDNQHKHRMVYR